MGRVQWGPSMKPEAGVGLHVAIIMDGNGRWAQQRGLPRVAGHRAGVAAIRRVVERAPDLGIRRLTLYAFSSDNWRRPAAEVQSIFWLLRAFLRLETRRLRAQGVRLQMIGRRDRIPRAALQSVEHAEYATRLGQRLELCVAIDYSSRDSIASAASVALRTRGKSESQEIPRQMVADALSAYSREVDMLIRTGGEKRLSDFLLWESAYAELVFTDRMWPEFNEADLEAAVQEFGRRQRRFGGLPPTAECDLQSNLHVG